MYFHFKAIKVHVSNHIEDIVFDLYTKFFSFYYWELDFIFVIKNGI